MSSKRKTICLAVNQSPLETKNQTLATTAGATNIGPSPVDHVPAARHCSNGSNSECSSIPHSSNDSSNSTDGQDLVAPLSATDAGMILAQLSNPSGKHLGSQSNCNTSEDVNTKSIPAKKQALASSGIRQDEAGRSRSVATKCKVEEKPALMRACSPDDEMEPHGPPSTSLMVQSLANVDAMDRNSDRGTQKKNKKSRLIWTPELHGRFMHIVSVLGPDKAVPRVILQMMRMEELTRENVASHLQKYRMYLKRLVGVGLDEATPTHLLEKAQALAMQEHADRMAHEGMAFNLMQPPLSVPSAAPFPNHSFIPSSLRMQGNGQGNPPSRAMGSSGGSANQQGNHSHSGQGSAPSQHNGGLQSSNSLNNLGLMGAAALMCGMDQAAVVQAVQSAQALQAIRAAQEAHAAQAAHLSSLAAGLSHLAQSGVPLWATPSGTGSMGSSDSMPSLRDQQMMMGSGVQNQQRTLNQSLPLPPPQGQGCPSQNSYMGGQGFLSGGQGVNGGGDRNWRLLAPSLGLTPEGQWVLNTSQMPSFTMQQSHYKNGNSNVWG